MEMLGIEDMRIIPAAGAERPPAGAGPEETVTALAAAKAREVARRCRADDVVIGADTVVWLDGHIFGKPRSRDQARRMLSALSGRGHTVYTGVCVIKGERALEHCEASAVYFRELSREEIDAYVDSGEPMDKAGAYGIQGRGALFVRRIEGDFFNVMGLPLCALGELLKKQGVAV